MRGPENQNVSSFFFFDVKQRIPQDHPLRIIKALLDLVLKRLLPSFDEMFSWTGGPSIRSICCEPWLWKPCIRSAVNGC